MHQSDIVMNKKGFPIQFSMTQDFTNTYGVGHSFIILLLKYRLQQEDMLS